MSSRVSSRSNEDERGRQAGRGFAVRSDNGSLVGSSVVRRVGAARAATTLETLTTYETSLIAHLARVRIATRKQLVRLQPPAASPLAETRRLQRSLVSLVERRVLARLDRPIGGRRGGSDGPLYALDVIGQRLAWEGTRPLRRPWFVGDRFVAHVLAVTDTYVRIVEGTRAGRLQVIDFDGEPGCWRHFLGSSGERQSLKPDAFVRAVEGDWEHLVFLEIDLATESLGTIAQKAKVYGHAYRAGGEQQRLGIFPAVVWLTVSERRRAALVDVLSRLPADLWKLHRVARLEEVARAIVGATSEPGT